MQKHRMNQMIVFNPLVLRRSVPILISEARKRQGHVGVRPRLQELMVRPLGVDCAVTRAEHLPQAEKGPSVAWISRQVVAEHTFGIVVPACRRQCGAEGFTGWIVEGR